MVRMVPFSPLRRQQEQTVRDLRKAVGTVVALAAAAYQRGRREPDPDLDALLAAGIERAIADLAAAGHPDLPTILAGLLQQGVPA